MQGRLRRTGTGMTLRLCSSLRERGRLGWCRGCVAKECVRERERLVVCENESAVFGCVPEGSEPSQQRRLSAQQVCSNCQVQLQYASVSDKGAHTQLEHVTRSQHKGVEQQLPAVQGLGAKGGSHRCQSCLPSLIHNCHTPRLGRQATAAAMRCCGVPPADNLSTSHGPAQAATFRLLCCPRCAG